MESRCKSKSKRLTGRVPKDPCPGFPPDSLGGMYVRKYNESHGFGRRINLAGSDTLFIGLRYQIEDMRPVLTVTYYEDGTGYTERYRFCRNGVVEELPPAYPYSEFSVRGLPDRPAVDELRRIRDRLPELKEDLRLACVESGKVVI